MINTATKQQNFNRDIKLEHKFHRIIKAILGNYFIYQDRIEDLENGTDFMLLEMKPFKIGVRLRRYKFYELYPNEFTIRWKRPTGVTTEYHKIMQGLVDYILYGFVCSDESKIIQYFIGDLSIFRKTKIIPIIKPNNPLDSLLAIYKLNQFPKEFVLKFWNYLNANTPNHTNR